jgi:hypothetical protein
VLAQQLVELNKKFWEEQITYCPWYDMDRIENDVSSNCSIVLCVFVTAVTFLPSLCLPTIGDFYRTEPLPSNDRGIHTQRLMGGIF